ncbi:MAG: phage regulatory CII family protein [Parashewanella sp.]
MYTVKKVKHAHLNGAYRQFAEAENLEEVAKIAEFHRPQMLRNKLCLEQPHKLTVEELISITKASGNRCIIDGVLLELDCNVSVSIAELQNAEQATLIERALDISANVGKLSSLALDIKVQKRVTERMRHEVINRTQRVMGELLLFAHEVEAKFQAVPVLSIAADALPFAGLS